MGWLILLLMVGLSLAALRLLGVRGGPLTASGAALVFAAAGYALQGSPELGGTEARSSEVRMIVPLSEARHAFFGSFTAAESWIRISEALARRGNSADSVGILQNAVRRYPGDPQLWVSLGNALVDHSRGLTPPAQLAYRRAAEVAPGHPAAPFFYGLALARSGEREAALILWQGILARAPADAAWRPLVEHAVQSLSGSPPPPEKGPPPAP